MKMFDECSQLELNLLPDQGFTCLQRDVDIAKHAVDAVLPEHGDDDSPRDLPYRPPRCGKLVDISGYLANSIDVTFGERRGTLQLAQFSSQSSKR